MKKKPTVRQCRAIEKHLDLNPAEYLIERWREHKGGVEVYLVHRVTGERLCVTLNSA